MTNLLEFWLSLRHGESAEEWQQLFCIVDVLVVVECCRRRGVEFGRRLAAVKWLTNIGDLNPAIHVPFNINSATTIRTKPIHAHI